MIFNCCCGIIFKEGIMITISAFAILGITATCFVGVPAAFSLFCKNQKVNKILSIIGMISFSAFALLLALPTRNFQNFMLTLDFHASSPWFNRMFSLGLGALDSFEVLVNCLMLAPLGVMACQNAKARGKKTAKLALLAGLLLSATIEVCQMILPFGRYPTVIDICWNVLGAGIGCVCLNICHKIKNFFVRKKSKINEKSENLENEKTFEKCKAKTRKIEKQKLIENSKVTSQKEEQTELNFNS